jgi:hypothetical protein
MKKVVTLVTSTAIVFFSCATPQVKTTSINKNYNSVREAISERSISWAGVTYRYDYIPFDGHRTLIATGENWGPTVNADLQGICLHLGGKALAYEKDPFTGKEKPLKSAGGWSFHWACVGGKDPFEVVVYRPDKYGYRYNVLQPIQPDWYILIKHCNKEPLILSTEMKNLVQRLKGKDWEEFFKVQEGTLLGAIFSDAKFVKVQRLKNGYWLAYYDTERKGLASIKGRFLPIYYFAAYCYANDGIFIEEDPKWIEIYKKRGLINAKFKCKGGNKPFEIKIEPDVLGADSITYKVYMKTY